MSEDTTNLRDLELSDYRYRYGSLGWERITLRDRQQWLGRTRFIARGYLAVLVLALWAGAPPLYNMLTMTAVAFVLCHSANRQGEGVKEAAACVQELELSEALGVVNDHVSGLGPYLLHKIIWQPTGITREMLKTLEGKHSA